MPLPAAVAVPPAAAAGAAAFAAGKHFMLHAAAHAAPLLDISTLSYSIIGYYLLKYIWKNKVPEWAKEDITFRNLLQSKSGGKNTKKKLKRKKKTKDTTGDASDSEEEEEEEEKEEMGNMASILEKLQALIKSVQIDDNHPSTMQQYAALLAYIQLCAQAKRQELLQQLKSQETTTTTTTEEHKKSEEEEEKKEQDGNDDEVKEGEEEEWTCRDSLYEKSAAAEEGTPSSSPQPQQLEQQALRFATYAYYDDPTTLSDRLEQDEDCYLLEHSLKSDKPGISCYYVAVSSRGNGSGNGSTNGTQQQQQQQQQQGEQEGEEAQQPQQQQRQRPRLILGIRGTSTIEDIVTDCCGRSVPFDDRSYYYDDNGQSVSSKRRVGRRTKINNQTNNNNNSIEVQAARPQQIIHQDHQEGYHPNHHQDEEGEEGIEIIRGETEQIWIDDARNDSNEQVDIYDGDDDTAKHYQHHDLLIRLNHSIYCHEGIMVSAKRLVDTIQHHVEYWVLQRGYKLIIAGHSLGAGCGALVGVMLRSRLPELQMSTTTSQKSDSDDNKSKMHVYCFAPPPVLDRETALRARSYVTSVVNNADMIPRCSIENLLILLEVLNGVWRTLQDQGLAPTGPKSCAKFFQKIAQGTTPTTTGGGTTEGGGEDSKNNAEDKDNSSDMIMTASDLRKLMATARKKVHQQQESLQQKVKDQQQESEHRHYYYRNNNNGIINNNNKPPTNDTTESCGGKLSSQPSPSSSKDEEETAKDSSSSPSDDYNQHHHPNLYIPGVVYVGYEPWNDISATVNEHDEEALQQQKLQQEAQLEQSESLLNRCGSTSSSSSSAANMRRRRQMKWITTDGTSDVLRFLEMDASSRMFMDHTTTSYYDLLDMEYEF